VRGCATEPGAVGCGGLMSGERQARPGQHAAVRARLGSSGAAGGAGRRRKLAEKWVHHGSDDCRETEACELQEKGNVVL
jgi:hypothetical protein